MNTNSIIITFENLPKAVTLLINEVASLKSLLLQNKKTNQMPIGVDKACLILGKAKPTVYAMVQKGLIPYYKNGKKLYFYEDELIELINSGNKKSIADLIRQ